MELNATILKFVVMGITAPLWWPFLRTIWEEYRATIDGLYEGDSDREDPLIHVPLVGVLEAPPPTSAVETYRVGGRKSPGGFGS